MLLTESEQVHVILNMAPLFLVCVCIGIPSLHSVVYDLVFKGESIENRAKQKSCRNAASNQHLLFPFLGCCDPSDKLLLVCFK